MSIELVIDGKMAKGRPDQTILDVAKENGIHIPTLCSHSRINPTGACRMCVVDIGRSDRLEAACTTPISAGMVVSTKNERVIKARHVIMELLLSSLNVDVRTIDKNGENILLELAEELGIDVDRTQLAKLNGIRRSQSIDDRNPIIIRDPNKCILCERCVSACNDVRHYGVLNIEGRGIDTNIVSGIREPLLNSGCASCGECVEVCPTGAFRAISREKIQGEIDNVIKSGNAFPPSGSTNVNRSRLGLAALDEKDAKDLIKIAKKTKLKCNVDG